MSGQLSQLGFRATLSKSYPAPVGAILNNFEISCGQGEIIALLGASGCGKSTILNLLADLLGEDTSENIEGSTLESCIGRDFAYAFQQSQLIPWRNVEANAYFETDILAKKREDSEERVIELLDITGLKEYSQLFPHQLSVGMQQRLQMARVGARRAKLLLLDEPLGAVDLPQRIRIAHEFRRLIKNDGATAVWVTHDAFEAALVADRVIVVSGRPIKVVMDYPIKRPSTPTITNDKYLGSQVSQDHAEDLDTQALNLQHAVFTSQGYESDLPQSELSLLQPRLQQSRKNNNDYRKILLPLLPVIILLIIWEGSIRLAPSLKFFTSLPTEWLPLLFSNLTNIAFVHHVYVTLTEMSWGLGIGLPIGVALGLFAGASRTLTTVLRPSLVGLTAVPLFVLAPAFILWFGIGQEMKVAIAALSCFPFVAMLVLDAAQKSKGHLYHYLKSIGAKKAKLFAHLILPNTLEAIILSLRPASVTALIGAFLGEFIASDKGLGYLIVLEASRYRVAEVIVGVTVLFLIAIMIDAVAKWLVDKRTNLIAILGI